MNHLNFQRPIKIRPATAADAPAIDEIERISFSHAGERFGPRKVRYLIDSPRAVAIIAQDGPNVVGWAVGFLSGWSIPPWGRVYGLAVHPAARGQRVGPRLLTELINQLQRRGAERLYLEVRPDNLRAIRLYEKLGFRPCRQMEHYYGPGVHAQRMVRTSSSDSAPTID